jgi:hypothetical protein
MNEKVFVVLVNGYFYRKDTAIRTYKTRERAVKESEWFVRHGNKVAIGEISVIDIEEVN